MTGKKIRTFGKKNSVRTQTATVRTAPRLLIIDGKLCAQVWYFKQKRQGGNVSISAPSLYTTFEISSGKIFKSRQLTGASREMLSFALNAAELEKDLQLKNYRAFLKKISASAPDKIILKQAENLWRKTLPKILRDWFEEKIF